MSADIASAAAAVIVQDARARCSSAIFHLTVSPDDANRIKRELGHELADRVRPTLAAAINATAAMLRKEVAKIYGRETGLLPSVAYTRLWVNRARRGRFLKSSVRLGAYGRHYDASNATQTPAGVEVSVGKRHAFLPHAFIQKMSTGHVGIFRREPDVKVHSRAYKQGIREVESESPTAVIERTGQLEPLRQKAAGFLSARVAKEIDKLFVGARR